MSTSLSTLLLVRDQRNKAAEIAAKDFEKIQAQVNRAAQHITTMQGYFAEVKSKNQARNKEEVFGDQIRSQNDFLDRVRSGIEAQKHKLELLQHQADYYRRKWTEALVSLKQIESLIAKRKEQDAYLENRRDQKLVDEFSGRSALSLLNNSH